MLIRMSRWATKPGMDADSRQLWEESVKGIWYRQNGLIQAHLLQQTGTANRMTFSVWRSAEDYERFTASQDLQDVAGAYDHIYRDEQSRPRATEWTVLTEDWPTRGTADLSAEEQK